MFGQSESRCLYYTPPQSLLFTQCTYSTGLFPLLTAAPVWYPHYVQKQLPAKYDIEYVAGGVGTAIYRLVGYGKARD